MHGPFRKESWIPLKLGFGQVDRTCFTSLEFVMFCIICARENTSLNAAWLTSGKFCKIAVSTVKNQVEIFFKWKSLEKKFISEQYSFNVNSKLVIICLFLPFAKDWVGLLNESNINKVPGYTRIFSSPNFVSKKNVFVKNLPFYMPPKSHWLNFPNCAGNRSFQRKPLHFSDKKAFWKINHFDRSVSYLNFVVFSRFSKTSIFSQNKTTSHCKKP